MQSEKELEIITKKLENWHQLARHVWAILLILAELHVGVKPTWKNRSLE